MTILEKKHKGRWSIKGILKKKKRKKLERKYDVRALVVLTLSQRCERERFTYSSRKFNRRTFCSGYSIIVKTPCRNLDFTLVRTSTVVAKPWSQVTWVHFFRACMKLEVKRRWKFLKKENSNKLQSCWHRNLRTNYNVGWK